MKSQEQDCPTGVVFDESYSVTADPELIADGWTRRNMADHERAQEAVDLYESLGFEVKVQKLSPEEFGKKCAECAAVACLSYVLIYTRKK